MTGSGPERIRALIDANLLLSYLVNANPARSAVAAIMELASRESFSLIVPREALDEAAQVLQRKPWLALRIPSTALEEYAEVLERLGAVVPEIAEPIPKISRDPGDDYLLAQAVRAGADYLVTRDKDLLTLGAVADVQIVDPVTFLALLRSQR